MPGYSEMGEVLRRLTRDTQPAKKRAELDYETLRARYEFLCQNMHKLRAEVLRHPDGRHEMRGLRFFRPDETWQNMDFELDPAEVDAKLAEVMEQKP